MNNPKDNESANGSSDPLTAIMRKYSQWRRDQLLATSKLPMRQLLLRTAYISGCILVDGVGLPWIVTALERTLLAYVLFGAALALLLIIQVKFYNRWKRKWK